MAFIDYYQLLGIDKSAGPDDIKKAYRKLARKYHPDVNPNDKEANKMFQNINEANEVLSDPEKRKKYDQYGENWKHGEEYEQARQSKAEQQSWGRGGGGFEQNENEYSDFFESLFGNATGKQRSARTKFRGNDVQAEMHVLLTEAYHTHQRVIAVNGKNLRITIPAGVENGQVLKLKGHGGEGVNGGPAGDLYVTFILDNNTSFERNGNDLFLKQDLDLYTAVLGGEININTLSGKIKLKILPGTQNGTKARIKSKGFPVYKNDLVFGDLYVQYNVLLPVNLSPKETELFNQLAALRQVKA